MTCGKVPYKSRKEAEYHKKDRHYKHYWRIYLCERCKYYHLTSSKSGKFMGQDEGNDEDY
jgi:hypothetical protein